MEVININKAKKTSDEKRKKELIKILEQIIEEVEQGNIDEFVGASLGPDGIPVLHAFVKDYVGGVGLFEIGKNTLMEAMQPVDFEDE